MKKDNAKEIKEVCTQEIDCVKQIICTQILYYIIFFVLNIAKTVAVGCR